MPVDSSLKVDQLTVAVTDKRIGSRLTYGQKTLGYAEESIEHCRRSQAIKKFLVRKGTASPSSAKPYSTHLTAFAFFIFESYQGQEVDGFIESIKQGKNDPYDILAEFAKFLRDTRTGENTLGGNQISPMVEC